MNPFGLLYNEGLLFAEHCAKLFIYSMSSSQNSYEVGTIIPILQARKVSCLALRKLPKTTENKQESSYLKSVSLTPKLDPSLSLQFITD